jgi:hypothetical protein
VLGDRRHLRTLAAIALAAAAEHAQQPCLHVRAQRFQRLLERVGRVRVIDHHQRLAVFAAEAVHAAVDRLQPRQRGGDVGCRHVLRMQRTSDREQVVDVESPQQRRTHVLRRAADGEVERDAAIVELQVFRTQRCIGRATRAHADASQVVRQCVEQRAAVVVVQVDHRGLQPRPSEQLGLRRAVAGHVAVVVEVVAGEIGEHRDVEMHARHAALVERMRADFHRHRLRAFVAQPCQQRVHRQHQRRGETGRHRVAIQAGTERADRRRTCAQQRPRLRDQLHGRRLAVGAGHANHAHRGARMIVEAIAHLAESRAQPGNGNGIGRRGNIVRRRRLEQDRAGT